MLTAKKRLRKKIRVRGISVQTLNLKWAVEWLEKNRVESQDDVHDCDGKLPFDGAVRRTCAERSRKKPPHKSVFSCADTEMPGHRVCRRIVHFETVDQVGTALE